MTITEIELPTGEKAISVDTEEDFGRAMETGLPIVAPDHVTEAYGLPNHEDAVYAADYAGPAADLPPDAV